MLRGNGGSGSVSRGRTWQWLSASIVAVLVTGCIAGDAGAPAGTLIYQAWDGRPTSTLVVADQSGSELRRIELPEMPGPGFALAGGERAIYHAENGGPIVVSAADGVARQLDLPADASSPLIVDQTGVFPSGSERAVLVDPQRGQAYLLDVASGEVFDLREVFEDRAFFLAGRLAPDESHLLLATAAGLWLVPTANPLAARRVGATPGDLLIGFVDPQTIAYAAATGDGEFSITTERLDGSTSRSLASVDAPRGWLLLPGRGAVLVQPDSGALLLVDLHGEPPVELATIPGSRHRFHASADEHRVLIGSETDSRVSWRLADLEARTVSYVGGLDGAAFSLTRDPARRLLLASAAPFTPRPDAGFLVAFDFETVEATRLLEIDAGSRLAGPPRSSADGRLAAVVVIDPDNRGVPWQLVLEDGNATRLPCADSCLVAAPSPDGRSVAVAGFSRAEGVTSAEVTLVSTEGGESKLVGDGVQPLWLQP